MTTPIVICDDSNMARKQMKRSLPNHWDVDITFAENGEEAIVALEKGLGKVLFLDLTMPVMDGYETLQMIRKKDLDTMVIVVSGDIQAEAHRRVISLGAMDFIKKPAAPDTVSNILSLFGIHRDGDSDNETAGDPDNETAAGHDSNGDNSKVAEADLVVNDIDNADNIDNKAEPISENSHQEIQFDSYREITNVAIGRAASVLAELTGEFVNLPVPKVSLLNICDLNKTMHFAAKEIVSGVCQGFTSQGITGEALLVLNDANFTDMAQLIKHDNSTSIEVLTDVSSILTGSILNALGDQLLLNFSRSCPVVLGVGVSAENLINNQSTLRQKSLTIEVNYEIPSRAIKFDILLLFTEESMPLIDQRLAQ